MPKSTNFTQCAAEYLGNTSLIAQWNYTGPVRLVQPNSSTQITYAGCKALCGTGNDWYPWEISSSFITTWVLPLLGNLLQAPFESNAFWRTVKLIARYLGSPIMGLTYILWNIEISGKCALFGESFSRFSRKERFTSVQLIWQSLMMVPYPMKIATLLVSGIHSTS